MTIELTALPDETRAMDTRDPVARRILTVLEACAANRRPATITELVEKTGLAKSTVHRMCWKLQELGMLDYSDDGFQIGAKMMALASANPDVANLRRTAMPCLMELQNFAGAANLAIRSGNRALIVDGLYTANYRLTPRTGAALPLHLTAVGKAMLASLDPDDQRQFLARGGLVAATPRSIVHPGRLRRELDGIAERGFAVALEEFKLGTVGVAAAFRVHGGLIAAIGSVGTSSNRAVLGSADRVVAAATQLQRIFDSRRMAVGL